METQPPNPYSSPQQTTPPPLTNANGLRHDELNWAMWCHLIPLITGLVGLFPLTFVGPLVILNISRNPSAFIDHHAKESLNFQISLLIYIVVLVGFAILTLGFGLILAIPLIIGLGIAGLIFEIMASIAANKGQYYRYPLSIRFIK